jgi:hypothetical protein
VFSSARMQEFVTFLSANGAQYSLAAFHIVSVKTKECLHLRTPDKPGGGGLELKPCQPSPASTFSLERGTTDVTPIMVKLTSSRFVCIVAPDEPIASLPKPLPVSLIGPGCRGPVSPRPRKRQRRPR